MKNYFRILLFSIVLSGLSAQAQNPTYYTGNTGSPSNVFPWGVSAGKAIQWLVQPGEFTGATSGFITKFYTQGTVSGTSTWTTLTIKMTQDVITTLPTGAIYSPIPTVVFSSASYTGTSNASGWLCITLQTPFLYDPTKSLIIEVSNCGSTNTSFQVTNVSKTGTNRRTYCNISTCPIFTYSGQSADLANLGIDISSAAVNDAGILSIDNPPVSRTPGIDTVKATLKDFGKATLVSADLGWSVNGVTQTSPASWTGSLVQNATATNLKLGTYTFGTGIYKLKAWSSNPNGVLDSNKLNDTATLTVYSCNPASGTYVIDQSGAGDFKTINNAIDWLKNCGISGPVTFRIKPGSYVEQLTIPAITGASATNTITFESYNLDSSSVNVIYSASATTNNWVLRYNGCNYVKFRKISITATGATYGTAVEFINAASNNSLGSCILQSISTAATTVSVVYSSTTLEQNNSIINNVIIGGYYGIYWYGTSTASLESGNIITGNIIKDFSYYGIYTAYQNAIKITGNTITSGLGTTSAYGIYATSCNNSSIFSQNKVLISAPATTIYGICLNTCVGTASLLGSLDNNFVSITGTSVGTIYGIYLTTASYVNVYYNSVNLTNAVTTSNAFYITAGTASTVPVMNNNFANTGGGYAIYTGSATTALGTCNYNNLYSSGTNVGYWTAATTTLAAWRTASAKDANSVSVNPAYSSSTDLHVNSLGISGMGTTIAGYTTDIDGDTRQNPPDIGADEFDLIGNDAGISAMATASPLCADTQNVSVKVKNFGSLQLTSVTVGWSVNGIPQPPFTTTSISLSQYAEATLTVGKYFFVLGTSYNFKFWTINPNGTTDGNNKNDTMLFKNFTTSLGGTFTIGPSGNYTTFNAALTALYSKGICSPVVFNVQPGTYVERLVLTPVKGASANNTITFNGLNSSLVKLPYAGTSTTLISTILFNGADYFTFKNMTIENTGATYGSAAWLMGKADYNTFDSCVLRCDTTATGSYIWVVMSNAIESTTLTYGNNADFTTISNCIIKGGYYGVRFNGTSSTVWDTGNAVINCKIDKVYYYGIYNYYQTKLIDRYNSFTNFRSTSAYGIYDYYGGKDAVMSNNYMPSVYVGIYNYYYNTNSQIFDNFIRATYIAVYNYYHNTSTNIERNDLVGGYMGIYSYYEDNPLDSSTYINNIIRIGSNTSYAYGYGIYLYYTTKATVWHNTVQTDTTYSSTPTSYGAIRIYYSTGIKIKNNIFICYGNLPILSSDGNGIAAGDLDYNIYYNSAGNIVAYWGTTTYTSFTVWKSSMLTFNRNSLFVDPQLISKYNLHQKPTAQLYKGTIVGITIDINKKERCLASPTIGADEHLQPYSKPVSDFYIDTIVCKNSPYTFINKANINDPNMYFWYANNKLKATTFHFSYKFTTSGIDTVTLITQNCSTSDTITKTFRVDTAFASPVSNFIANKNLVEVNEAVNMLDLSTNCPERWQWTIMPDSIDDPMLGYKTPTYVFSKSTATSQLPNIVFLYSGKYSICLTTYNSIDTGTTYCNYNYIEVKPSALLCVYPFDTKELSGTLYDEGGFNGPYMNNKTCGYAIHPCTKEVRAVFKTFDIASGDFLRIFDGPDNKSRPLWNTLAYPTGINNSLFVPSLADTFIGTSGKIYVELATDASTVGNGFQLNWTSDKDSYIRPVASFLVADTVCNGANTVFLNTSTGDQNDNYWDFENDNNTDATTVNGVNRYLADGDYDVKLMVSGCGGMDTFIKRINVRTALFNPQFELLADNYKPSMFTDIVNVSENTLKNCVDTVIWDITPKKYTLVSGNLFGSSSTIALKFNDTACYDFKVIGIYNGMSDTMVYPCFIKPLYYCKPVASNISPDIGISRVAINTINNYSDIGVKEYTDYFNTISTDLEIGARYSITLERLTNFNPIGHKVWIDFNLDGYFDDKTELAAYDYSSNGLVWSGTLKVKNNLPEITTRMRVGTTYGGTLNRPCGPNNFGEYEDYKVRFIPDHTKPIINLIGATTMHIAECTQKFIDPKYTAIDNVDTNIVDSVKVTGTVDPKTAGTYYVHYNLKDAAGNVADELIRTVIVDKESVPPTLILKGAKVDSLLVYNKFTDPGFTVSDTCSGLDTVIIVSTLDTAKLGIDTITYTAIDKVGNITKDMRIIYVIDTVAPVIVSKSSDTIELNVNQLLPNPLYTVTDNYYKVFSVNIKGTYYQNFPNGEATALGFYTFRYIITDGSGNSDSIDYVIHVVDGVKPLLQLKGFFYYKLCRFDTLVDPGYIVTDNFDKKPKVVKSGNYVTDYLVNRMNGNYELIYTASDVSGNSTSDLRYIFVTDQDSCHSAINYPETFEGISLYPSMGDGRFSLNFNTSKPERIKITVSDALGNVISETEEIISPLMVKSFNYNNLKQGMYYIQLSKGDKIKTLKYILMK